EALAEALRARLQGQRAGAEEMRLPVPDDLWSGGGATGPRACYHALDTVLEEAAALCGRLAQDDPTAFGGADGRGVAPSGAATAAFGGLARRAAALRTELGQMIDAGGRDRIRWLAVSARNVSLRASP